MGDISEAFLQRGYKFIPDTGKLQQFAEGLDQSLKGTFNFAIADTLNDQAAQAREDSIRIISESLNPYTEEDYAGLSAVEKGELANLEEEYRKQMQDAPRGSQPKAGERLQELRAKDGRAEASNRLRFDVNVSSAGDITATRQVATGAAKLARGDGTSAGDYDSITRAQDVKIAAPQAVQLVETGNLFGEWQTGDVINGFYSNLNEGQEQFSKQMSIVSNRLNEANDEAQHWQNEFYKSSQKAAEQAQFNKAVLEAALQSIAFGMAPHLALRNAMAGEIRGRVAGMFEQMTGIPAGFLSGLLGGSSVKQALASYAEGVFWNHFQEVNNLPPDVANLFRTWVSSEMKKANFRKDRRKAARFKIEDASLITYAWRNQAYHDDLNKSMQVVETTAGIVLNTVGNIFAGAGTAIWIAYNTAKQTYVGSLQGGSKGAVTGFASGTLNGIVSPYGASVNFAYSYADGYSGSVGMGIPLEGVNGNLGLSLGFDKSGVTGGGVGFRNDAIALGLNYHKGAGLSAFAGSASRNGAQSAGLGISEQGGLEAYAQHGSMERGAGRLTFSERDGLGVGLKTQYFDASHSQHGGTTVSTSYGFDSESPFSGANVGASFNSNTGFSVNGSYSGGGYTANYTIGEGGAITSSLSRNDNPSQYMITNLDQLRGTVDSIANQRQKQVFLTGKRDTIDRARLLRGEGAISDAQFAALVANPEALSKALHAAGDTLAKAGFNDQVAAGKSNDDTGDSVWNGVSDFFRGVVGGQLSDKDGYIDPVTGEYRQRTCFVAGTLVRVPDGTGDNGGNYKMIEEIQAGDLVLSWNEKTGEVSPKPVTDTFIRETPEIYAITLENGEVIETTWSHRFYVEGTGWVEAKDLQAGDSFLTTIDNSPPISRITVRAKKATVYNFAVKDLHTYFVTELSLLVHNEFYDRSTKYASLIRKLNNSGWSLEAEKNLFVAAGSSGVKHLLKQVPIIGTLLDPADKLKSSYQLLNTVIETVEASNSIEETLTDDLLRQEDARIDTNLRTVEAKLEDSEGRFWKETDKLVALRDSSAISQTEYEKRRDDYIKKHDTQVRKLQSIQAKLKHADQLLGTASLQNEFGDRNGFDRTFAAYANTAYDNEIGGTHPRTTLLRREISTIRNLRDTASSKLATDAAQQAATLLFSFTEIKAGEAVSIGTNYAIDKLQQYSTQLQSKYDTYRAIQQKRLKDSFAGNLWKDKILYIYPPTAD